MSNDNRDNHRNPAAFDPRRYGLPSGPITKAEDVREVFDYVKEAGLNLLSPLTTIDYIPPGYQLMLRVVHFPTEGLPSGRWASNGLWYRVDGGKLAMHKTALMQLCQAVGANINYSRRVDDGRTVLYWRYEAQIEYLTFDGIRRKVTGQKEVDLRDGSPLAMGMTDNQLREARKHGAALAESKAINKAVRNAFGVGAYTPEAANRPFVFPCLRFVPDMSNPAIAQMVAATELGVVDQVYGQRPAPIDITPEPEVVPEARRIEAPVEDLTAAELDAHTKRTERRGDPEERRAPKQERRRYQTGNSGGGNGGGQYDGFDDPDNWRR